MAVIITNKDMPECCNDCFAFDVPGDYPYCLLTGCFKGNTFNTRKYRMENCPLKPFNITLESPSTFIQGQKCFDTSTYDAYKYDENKGWEKYE